MSGFQCWFDRYGDLNVANGILQQPKQSVILTVGSGAGFSVLSPDRSGGDLTTAPAATGATFVGGSGRNLIASGSVIGLSSGVNPAGFYRPTIPGFYRLGFFTLEVLGASSATISDETGVVAELTTGGTAPVGDFDSTTYGAATYNATTAFTLAVTAEGGTSVGIPSARLAVSAGSAITGEFTAVDESTFESDTDPDWTIVIDPDGSAELRYLTDVVATRAAGEGHDPSGAYQATTLGMATYNLTTEEPVDGEPWRALCQQIGKSPRVGYVYLAITETAGVVTSVDGPFFATSIPANSGTTYHFQIAYSDGYDVRQDHSGAIVWP